jgi:16S rRNA C967 or C1407 C5-methylase (RsmB/RsmF family)/NOL1/NOP2/fmu family ribosome biogenesis protein
MLLLPEDFKLQMEADLQEEAKLLFDALESESPTSVRFNPFKTTSENTIFDHKEPVIWANNAYYLPKRPSFTFDPFFHAGYYYVQEASSMFLEEVFRQHVKLNESLRVLDVCAAPGGKSTHIASFINQNSLLISNEVITNRASILVENLTRWGNANVIVTNNDPEHFSDLENCFDVVVIDAPCSGEGMFRKDKDSIAEWSLNNVNICSARQKRILHTASKLLRTNGIIIYSTCTYNTREDVEPMEELIRDGAWESLPINISKFSSIVERRTDKIFGYHFYPHKIKGEGFYISVLRKTDAEERNWPKVMKNINYSDKKTRAVIANYINMEGLEFIQHNQQTLAFPIAIKNEMLGILNTSLRIKKFGIDLGQVIRDELIPEQALAHSTIALKKINTIELNKEQAIMYLQKKEFNVESTNKGWHLMTYDGAALGFAKLIGNRMNNTYPKEWRIRSEAIGL